MTFNTVILSIANTLNKIYLITTIFNESTLTYYDDKNDGFELLFKKYTSNYVLKSDHPDLIQQWKAEIDKEDYERKINKYV